jgi:hypothetical protein
LFAELLVSFVEAFHFLDLPIEPPLGLLKLVLQHLFFIDDKSDPFFALLLHVLIALFKGVESVLQLAYLIVLALVLHRQGLAHSLPALFVLLSFHLLAPVLLYPRVEGLPLPGLFVKFGLQLVDL